jgi:hypothetical protein
MLFLCVSATWVLNSAIILSPQKIFSINSTHSPTLRTLQISVHYHAGFAFFLTISSPLFDIHLAVRIYRKLALSCPKFSLNFIQQKAEP